MLSVILGIQFQQPYIFCSQKNICQTFKARIVKEYTYVHKEKYFKFNEVQSRDKKNVYPKKE